MENVSARLYARGKRRGAGVIARRPAASPPARPYGGRSRCRLRAPDRTTIFGVQKHPWLVHTTCRQNAWTARPLQPVEPNFLAALAPEEVDSIHEPDPVAARAHHQRVRPGAVGEE